VDGNDIKQELEKLNASIDEASMLELVDEIEKLIYKLGSSTFEVLHKHGEDIAALWMISSISIKNIKKRLQGSSYEESY